MWSRLVNEIHLWEQEEHQVIYKHSLPQFQNTVEIKYIYILILFSQHNSICLDFKPNLPDLQKQPKGHAH